MATAIDFGSPIIVIEHCLNCNAHNWNNRHDENKYSGYAMNVAEAIKERLPNAQIFINEIPKKFMFSDNYTQLIPDNPNRDDTYPMLPRIGAFEVSSVIAPDRNQGDVLFYSKLMSSCWPHIGNLAARVEDCFI